MSWLTSTINLFAKPLYAKAANLSDAFTTAGDVADKGGYNTNSIDDPTGMNTAINTVLSFLGIIFLGFMIYGGIMWMTAQGSEEKVKKAKGILMNATIGLIIVAGAYVISYAVVKYIITDRVLQS